MLNWLVIGIGDITRKRVLPAILAEPRSVLRAILTRDARKAEAYPGVIAYTNLDEALSDASVDAVYVASPVALHAEQTIASLRAGKHVLCEKPVAMNLLQAQAMAEAARESGRLAGISYYRRLYPKLVRAKERSGSRYWWRRITTAGWRARSAAGCVTRQWVAAVLCMTWGRIGLTHATSCLAGHCAPWD
jgi:predicted dehydrogenase